MSDVPLQNIDAEEGVLGGILLDPGAISLVANILTPQAFFITAHQRIYEAALVLHNKNKPTDLMSVTTWLADHELLEKVGGQSKLAQLVERTVCAVNIDRYAELILDKYQRRQLITAANEVIILAKDTSTELETVLDHSEQKIFGVTKYHSDRFEPESIGDCLIAAFHQLEGGETSGISAGLLDLDGLTGGLIRLKSATPSREPPLSKTVRETFASHGSSVTRCLSHIPHCQHIVFPVPFWEDWRLRLGAVATGFVAETAIFDSLCIVAMSMKELPIII